MKKLIKFLLVSFLFLGFLSSVQATPIRVLGIDTTTAWDYNTVSGLTNVTFTEVSTAGFSAVNLSDYDVLMVSETFTNGSVTVSADDTLNALKAREGDIATWLSQGNGIIAWSEPIGFNPWEWLPDAIEPANANSGHDNSVIIQDATHPVMAGLSTTALSGWGTSSHNSFASYASSWDVLASNSTGGAVTIAGTYGSGRVVLSAQDPDFHYTSPSGPQALFAQNAINWVGGANPIPEPTTVALFGAGLLFCAGMSRKKR